MTKFITKFTIEVGTEAEACEMMECIATLPFVPSVGMMLVAMPDDDFRCVEDVYWSPAGGLEVFFAEAYNPIKQMKSLGWKIVK